MHIYVDCTDTYFSGRNTGIQRVVRNFARHAMVIGPSLNMECTPTIFKFAAIIPLNGIDDFSLQAPRETLRSFLNKAYLTAVRRIAALLPFPLLQRFLLAHRSQFGLAWLLFLPLQFVAWLRPRAERLQVSPAGIEDSLEQGDIIFLPDASWSADVFETLKSARSKGLRVIFFMHDIIPLTHPEVCHPVHVERFQKWFCQVMENADLLVCNSHFTKQCIEDHVGKHTDFPHLDSAVVHLGHDLGQSPTGDVHHRMLRHVLLQIPQNFLCVGTLEPRKNLDVLIDAFDDLWRDGQKVSLVLIGKEGWLCDELLIRIRKHAQQGKFLFWFNDVDDADLARAYRKASALIFPSIVEGFGLPLVEALCQGLPVIVSDIPVFREIAKDSARYFPPTDPTALALVIKAHLADSPAVNPATFQWPTWEECTRHLLTTLQTFADGKSGQV